jgi:RimJ/RimL family protein N-acetyltransferase
MSLAPIDSGLAFRPMIEADLPAKVRWSNDPRVNEWIGMAERVNLEGTRKWFAAQNANPRLLLFTITFEGQPIGFTKLERSEDGREGCLSGVAIGEPEFWGRGLGKQTVQKILQIAFEQEHWTRFWLECNSWNLRAIGLYRSFGFEHVGKAEHRRRHPEDGTEHDVLILAITSAQWAAHQHAAAKP